MIRVLIVDDSALIREMLTLVLSEDDDIEVVDAVSNPYLATQVLNRTKVDVISLDLEMPRMDGLTFLEKIMKQKPIPVVVCSSIAEEGSKNAIQALELGAIEVITKPKLGLKNFLVEEKNRIQDAIKSAAKVDLDHLRKMTKINSSISAVDKSKRSQLLTETTDKVIAIGASTGGTIVLRYILSKLPRTCKGIIISQHMPEGFTKSFSEGLDRVCEIDVKESENNDKVAIGKAIIARGAHHLIIGRHGAFYQCRNTTSALVNRHRPSVDVMFNSIAETVGQNALAILLTGMGKDGAEGLKAIKEAGGRTIAQNEKSCVVYGMPKAAVDIGATDAILDPDEIIKEIINFK